MECIHTTLLRLQPLLQSTDFPLQLRCELRQTRTHLLTLQRRGLSNLLLNIFALSRDLFREPCHEAVLQLPQGLHYGVRRRRWWRRRRGTFSVRAHELAWR